MKPIHWKDYGRQAPEESLAWIPNYAMAILAAVVAAVVATVVAAVKTKMEHQICRAHFLK